MQIKKAVIPAAGFGTRVLPFTKAIPKEMIPIIDKPSIQYIAEEAVKSGITDILIIVSRGKTAIEEHFDRSEGLENKLLETGKTKLLEQIKSISTMANFSYIIQEKALGLGHAISLAENFIDNEPFAVLYGDDVILSEIPVCRQLCDAYEKYGNNVVGIKQVPHNLISKYSSLSVSNIDKNIYKINDMVEKPSENEILSDFSILGRCILTPEIFTILNDTKPGKGGEIQLTDAMKVLALKDEMNGVDFEGTRYDMGNKFEILKANVECGIKNEEFGKDFQNYLKSLVNTL